MSDGQPATLVIYRDTGRIGLFWSLCIWVDGKLVGQVPRHRCGEYLVEPGFHLVQVAIGQISSHTCLRLRAGERLEMVCESNAQKLGSMVSHGLLIGGVVVALDLLGKLFPAFLGGAILNSAFESYIAVALAAIGIPLFFYRVTKNGAWIEKLMLRALDSQGSRAGGKTDEFTPRMR